jgi:hypothetical protein
MKSGVAFNTTNSRVSAMSKIDPMPRGGKRPGAGKKRVLPEGTKQWNIQVTDDEKKKIKALLEELRKPSK